MSLHRARTAARHAQWRWIGITVILVAAVALWDAIRGILG